MCHNIAHSNLHKWKHIQVNTLIRSCTFIQNTKVVQYILQKKSWISLLVCVMWHFMPTWSVVFRSCTWNSKPVASYSFHSRLDTLDHSNNTHISVLDFWSYRLIKKVGFFIKNWKNALFLFPLFKEPDPSEFKINQIF